MLTTRWNPSMWDALDRFHKDMTGLFQRVPQGDSTFPSLSIAYPPINMWGDADNLYVEAELPGLQLDKLEIYVTEGNQLTIQGVREPHAAPQGVWHRQERGFGKFSRVVTLPVAVDADKVQARFEQGVLQLTLPRAESAKPKRIPVKAS